MDAVVKPWPKQGLSEHVRAAPQPVEPRPSREQAEAAVRTLIAFAGDDPDREGLLDTPARVVRAYKELFSGYEIDPREYLERTFDEVGGYDELVVLKDIRVVSFCEHHMLPFLGKAHVGYLPRNRVVGISKALEWCMSGRVFGPEEALAAGDHPARCVKAKGRCRKQRR